MKLAFGCSALILTISCNAQESSSNYKPRLKIAVAFEDANQMPNINIGDISVCSQSACYKPTVLSRNQNTAGLTVLIASDTNIPPSEIDTIKFEKSNNSNVVGSVKLARNLKLTKEYYGGEIFVTLKQDLRDKELAYRATYATSSYLTEKGHSVYYNPRFPLEVNLSHGITLDIPEGSLATPELFHVAIHDVGKEFPLVDIYPVVNLKKDATVKAAKIQRATTVGTSQAAVVAGPPPVSFSTRSTLKTSSSGKSERSFRKTGRFKLSSDISAVSDK